MTPTRNWAPVAEAAARLGVSVSTMHNMIKDGRIYAFRLTGAARGRLCVPNSEIERHLIETGQLAEPTAA